MMLHTNYQSSRPYVFRQEDFFYVSPYISLCKHVIPGAWPFWPQGSNLNKLGRGPPDDASYQISRLYALWGQTRRFFMCFPIKAYVKPVTPEAGHFGPRAII